MASESLRMIKGPSIKLPKRRLSELTKTPSKSKNQDKDGGNHPFQTPKLHTIQMETIHDGSTSNNQQLSPRQSWKENVNPNDISMNNNFATSPRQRLSVQSSIDRDNNNNNMMQVDTDNDDEDRLSAIQTHIDNHNLNDDNHSEVNVINTTKQEQETEFVATDYSLENIENIQCMVRIRPLLAEIENRGRVCVDLNESNNMITIDCKPKAKSFTFDHVGSMRSTQESIFQSVGKPITNACLSGYNGTIFAYGQTGSGKTFTLLGINSIHIRS